MERLWEAAEEYFWPPTPRQVLNKASRDIERGLRRLERQRMDCDAKESAGMRQLRSKAEAGLPLPQVRALARDVARVRASRAKVYAAAEALEGLRGKLVSTQVAAEVGAVMTAATAALSGVPGVADPARLRTDVVAFERAQMGLEVYEDALGSALDDGDAAQEGDEIADQILDEMGIKIDVAMPNAPSARGWPHDDRAEQLIIAASTKLGGM